MVQSPDPADKTDEDYSFLSYLTYTGGLSADLPPEAADLNFFAGEQFLGITGAQLAAIAPFAIYLTGVGIYALGPATLAGLFIGTAALPIINIVVLAVVVIAVIISILLDIARIMYIVHDH